VNTRSFTGVRGPGGLDLAAQGAADQFGNANLFPPRFDGQDFSDLSREAERHRHTAVKQFRSGHEACVLWYHTRCQSGIFLPCHIAYDTVGRVRDKESTAITITLPSALNRALQALADQKHCGNKSAAIREILYKEAGMQATLRMNEKKDSDSVTNAEHRSVKYGSRGKKKSGK
jgi:hypothetical protein